MGFFLRCSVGDMSHVFVCFKCVIILLRISLAITLPRLSQLSSHEVLEMYSIGSHADAFESSSMLCMDAQDCLRANLPGCHRGVLQLYIDSELSGSRDEPRAEAPDVDMRMGEAI
jgi:hypothetical protein